MSAPNPYPSNTTLECNACKTVNPLAINATVDCSNCGTSLLGINYRKAATSGALLFILVGGALGVNGSRWLDHRYPIHTEFEIISSCASNAGTVIGRQDFARIQKICSCALEKAQDSIDYDDYKAEPKSIGIAMGTTLKECV